MHEPKLDQSKLLLFQTQAEAAWLSLGAHPCLYYGFRVLGQLPSANQLALRMMQIVTSLGWTTLEFKNLALKHTDSISSQSVLASIRDCHFSKLIIQVPCNHLWLFETPIQSCPCTQKTHNVPFDYNSSYALRPCMIWGEKKGAKDIKQCMKGRCRTADLEVGQEEDLLASDSGFPDLCVYFLDPAVYAAKIAIILCFGLKKGNTSSAKQAELWFIHEIFIRLTLAMKMNIRIKIKFVL